MRLIQFGPKLWAILIGMAMIASCEKQRCEEEAPMLTHDTVSLEFEENQQQVLYINSKFKDCQGDIGALGEEDTMRTVRTFLYEWYDNEWHRFYHADSADSILFFSIIPGSEKVKENEPVEGNVIQRFANVRQNSDTIRFETYIFDRSGNRSNRVTTPQIVLP